MVPLTLYRISGREVKKKILVEKESMFKYYSELFLAKKFKKQKKNRRKPFEGTETVKFILFVLRCFCIFVPLLFTWRYNETYISTT